MARPGKKEQSRKTRKLLLHIYKKTGKPIGVKGKGFTRIFRRIGKKHGIDCEGVRVIAAELERNGEIKLIRSNRGGHWPIEEIARTGIQKLAINTGQFHTTKSVKRQLDKKLKLPKHEATISNIISLARKKSGLGILGLKLLILRKHATAGRKEQMRRMAITSEPAYQKYLKHDRKVSIELNKRKKQLQENGITKINNYALYEEIVKEMFPPKGI